MKQETALQKLIAKLEEERNFLSNTESQLDKGAMEGLRRAIESAKILLPYERDVIENAYDTAQKECINIVLDGLKEQGLDMTEDFKVNQNKEDAKQYYETQFKTE